MNHDEVAKAIEAASGRWYSAGLAFAEAIKAIRTIGKAFRRVGKWKMTAKTGRNKKERQRDQVRLKGRGCRVHRGRYPGRGKGTTSRSR